MFENRFPKALRSLNKLEFDYLDGEGIDFEPYRKFLSGEEATDWLRSWTGNRSVSADNYRIFGQDGSGGLAAIWTARPDKPLLEQPIVFFGSEGELGVVASCFGDYLWLLAQGVGPHEAIAYGAELARKCEVFDDFARRHAPDKERPAEEILESAKHDFSTFENDVRDLCG